MGAETIRQHDYIDGKCQHCGDRQADNVGERESRSCVGKIVPRATPTSIFESTEGRDAIYDRLQELKAERDAILANTTSIA